MKYHQRLMEMGVMEEGFGTPVLAMSLLDRFLAVRAARGAPQLTLMDIQYLGWAAHWVAVKHAKSAYGLGKWMAKDLEEWDGVRQKDLRNYELILLLGLGKEKPKSDGGAS